MQVKKYSLQYCSFLFRKLGEAWFLSEDVIKDIEGFTCLMYGYPRESSVNAVRSIMLKKMVGQNNTLTVKSRIDLARLPPCNSALIPHIQRVNHRAALYKRAQERNIQAPNPSNAGQGWDEVDNGALEPLWTLGPVLPTSLIDLLDAAPCDLADDIESEEEDGAYDEFEDFDDDD